MTNSETQLDLLILLLRGLKRHPVTSSSHFYVTAPVPSYLKVDTDVLTHVERTKEPFQTLVTMQQKL